MLEVGKTYKAIQDKEKLIEFEVLKVNKKSYAIMLKDKKETLWINNSGELYLNNPNYSLRVMSRLYQPPRFDIKIVNEYKAKLFTIKNDLKVHKERLSFYEADLIELGMKEREIQNKKNDLKIRIEWREKEIEKLEKELEEMENDKKERE